MSNSGQLDIHLNLNIRGLGVSATLGINELSQQLQAQGHQVYRLGLGQSPFPVPAVVEDALRQNAWQKDYLPVMGLRELRHAVSDYLNRTQGVNFTPEHIMIGPGSKELMFILQLVYYGDLLIPTPSWVSYAPQARIIGRQVHWLPTNGKKRWKLTAESLDAFCQHDTGRPRLVILNYPANPHGYTYAEEELAALADVARRHKLIMLSDEIYGELHFQGRHQSIARHYPEGTIISSGLSKWCGAGGWRLGTFAFPTGLEWLRDNMATVASETYTSVSAPIQHAAVRAFQGGIEIEQYLHQSRRVLEALMAMQVTRLNQAGVRVAMPDGAFYLFPDLSTFRQKFKKKGIRNSRQMCETLLAETGVAALPGSAFGRPDDEFTLRLAYVDFDGARALAEAEKAPSDQPLSDDFLRAHCFNCVTATERMVAWLDEL